MSDEKPDFKAVFFGIGCFSFEAPEADLLLMQNPSGTYSVHDWARDVREYLAAIPSVDNIRVDGFRSVRGDHPLTWRDTTVAAIQTLEHDGSHHGGDLRPHPTLGRVAFTVTIPIRTQSEIMVYAEGRTGTRFDVDIRYGPAMPVAYVRTYADSEDPSLAVAIVREFMLSEQRARPLTKSPIRFVAIGPSPMWSNFELLVTDVDTDEELSVDVEEGPGYDWVTLKIAVSDKILDDEQAYSLVKARMQESVSTYYEFVSQGMIRYATRRFIEAELEELVIAHRATGFRAWFKRLWTSGRKANDLMLQILAIDLEQRRAEKGNTATWDSVRGNPAARAMESHVARELGSVSENYVENSREVVSVLNSRHVRDIEVVSVVVASILGGAVGAALTAFASAGSAGG